MAPLVNIQENEVVILWVRQKFAGSHFSTIAQTRIDSRKEEDMDFIQAYRMIKVWQETDPLLQRQYRLELNRAHFEAILEKTVRGNDEAMGFSFQEKKH
jgi:hypothetical protein